MKYIDPTDKQLAVLKRENCLEFLLKFYDFDDATKKEIVDNITSLSDDEISKLSYFIGDHLKELYKNKKD